MYQPDSGFEFGADLQEFEEELEFNETEWDGEDEIFTDGELIELAGELMDINSDEELDYFLGKLVRRAAGAIGKAVRSPVGKAVTGALRGVAKKALPLAGKALGAYVGGPLGAKIGGGLATAAGSALGLEAEFMNDEDVQFEGGKQFVRLAGQTVKNTLQAPAGSNPQAVAQQAAAKAAKSLAPGLLAQRAAANRAATGGSGNAGRWIRRGRHILILNA